MDKIDIGYSVGEKCGFSFYNELKMTLDSGARCFEFSTGSLQSVMSGMDDELLRLIRKFEHISVHIPNEWNLKQEIVSLKPFNNGSEKSRMAVREIKAFADTVKADAMLAHVSEHGDYS